MSFQNFMSPIEFMKVCQNHWSLLSNEKQDKKERGVKSKFQEVAMSVDLIFFPSFFSACICINSWFCYGGGCQCRLFLMVKTILARSGCECGWMESIEQNT
jgi:hypothetical protein